jgi:hypothetical protein
MSIAMNPGRNASATPSAQVDRPDLRGVRQHRDEDVGSGRDLPGRPAGGGTFGDERSDPGRDHVVDDQPIPRAKQVGGHRPAHDPKADEPDRGCLTHG